MDGLVLLRGDITRQTVDAIVNAANARLAGGGGVDGAIHRAGGPEIMKECDEIRRRDGGCPTGTAVATGAGRLAARYVIHTAGPIWNGGGSGEARLLASCYRSSLALAASLGCRTIAFPSISTGIYGYPVADAAGVAIETIASSLGARANIYDEVRMVLFSEADLEAYRSALRRLR